MTKLVLKDGDAACFWNDCALELFMEHGLATLEVVVEIDEDRMQGDLMVVGTVPVIHMGFEALPRAVTIETQAIVERKKSKWAHPFGEVWAKSAKEVNCEVWIIADDAVLIPIDRIVGRKGRGRTLDQRDKIGAFGWRVDLIDGPEHLFPLESHWHVERHLWTLATSLQLSG